MTSLENIEGHLVTHLDQGGDDELQHHSILIRHQVPHVLQDEVPGSVEITETILKLFLNFEYSLSL